MQNEIQIEVGMKKKNREKKIDSKHVTSSKNTINIGLLWIHLHVPHSFVILQVQSLA